MGIGKMAGEAAIEVMKNENVQNKTESVIGMLFPYECFLLGKHTVERVCSGLSPLRRDRLWC